MADHASEAARHLHVVRDSDVTLEAARARALALYKNRYSDGESRRAMVGALRAAARLFTVPHEAAFEWECLADPALVSVLCDTARSRYKVRSVNRIQVAVRRCSGAA